LSVLVALAAAEETAEEGEQEEAADGGADADDQGFVVLDPGFDLAADGGAATLTLEIVSDLRECRGVGMNGWMNGWDLRCYSVRLRRTWCRRGSFAADRSRRWGRIRGWRN
jgi:hypothetical protein